MADDNQLYKRNRGRPCKDDEGTQREILSRRVARHHFFRLKAYTMWRRNQGAKLSEGEALDELLNLAFSHESLAGLADFMAEHLSEPGAAEGLIARRPRSSQKSGGD